MTKNQTYLEMLIETRDTYLEFADRFDNPDYDPGKRNTNSFSFNDPLKEKKQAG